MLASSPRAPVDRPLSAAAALSSGTALAQVSASVRTMLTEGRSDEAVEYLLAALAAVLEKSSELELLIARMRRERVGKRSERVNQEQLALLFEELMRQGSEPELSPEQEAQVDAALTQEIEAAEAAGASASASAPGAAPRRRVRGYWRTSASVERKVHHVTVSEKDRTCGVCGRVRKPIGSDISRVLRYVPAHFVEDKYQLEKYACGHCKDGVTTAVGPARVLEKRAADSSLLAHVVVSKYADHTPLTRLSRIYQRSGATIPVSTMAEWVGAVADLVAPIADALETRIKGAWVIGTDATGLKVLDPGSPEHIERGTMWCYVGDGRDVVFKYTPTGEGASGPWDFLQHREGYVQADAASVFDRVFNGEVASAVEVGCWAHARRRFVALQGTDCRVAYPLQLMARLYRVEHLADARQLTPGDRALLRRERDGPVLEKLKRLMANVLPNEPPSSELAKAMRYVLNHWEALTRFLDDGRLRLDNNITEQQIRDIAVGRKNYLFAGSHAAAERAAVLYSLMRTCAQHGVAPLPYLTDVMLRVTRDTPIEDLLPDRWQAIYGATKAE